MARKESICYCLPRSLSSKESTCQSGDLGSIPEFGEGNGKPREGNSKPFQYSYLGNPMDRGAWWATVHGMAKSLCYSLTINCSDSLKFHINPHISSVQSLSCIRLLAAPWTAAHQASLSITCSSSLLKLMSIESVMPSNQLILCCPLLLLPSIFPSIRVFPNESVLRIRCPKNWSFSFSISPSNEHSGLVSFRMDWLDLLAVLGTLKSLQHHSPKASILRRSAFFIVQLSHPYMTTGKTIALSRRTFVGKVMSLVFNAVFIY